jgi:hypothetical protein
VLRRSVEITGEMRHPVYLGLRADKRAEEVLRERETTRK